MMTNINVKGTLRCAKYLSIKLFSDLWAKNYRDLIFTLLNLIKQNMLTYSVKCRKKTGTLNSKILNTKNGRLRMQSKCAECGIKKSRFVKEQEAKRFLSNLGIKTPLSKFHC